MMGRRRRAPLVGGGCILFHVEELRAYHRRGDCTEIQIEREDGGLRRHLLDLSWEAFVELVDAGSPLGVAS